MADELKRSRDYFGPVTDTRIWDHFELRHDDIILSTPPKCGTTWSQAILMMLIRGSAVTDQPVWRDSIWLDCGIRDTALNRDALDAQTQRRCIKSHSPRDSLPYDPRVTFITVFRHPIDVYFSLEKHVANMNFDILDFMFSGTAEENFDRFLNAPATDTGTDDLTLASMLHHYRSFREWAQMPNIHFFHYADLTADTEQQIRLYAKAIGVDITDKLVAEIAGASSFGNMKEVTRRQPRADGKGAFKVEHKFFDSASSNKWEDRLNDAQMAAYHQRIQNLASPDEIAFLEGGNTLRHA